MLLAFEDFASWLDAAESFSGTEVEFEPAAEAALLLLLLGVSGIMGGAGRIGERCEFLAVLRISID